MITMFQVRQIVRVSCFYSITYGRIARVVENVQRRMDVQFAGGYLNDNCRYKTSDF